MQYTIEKARLVAEEFAEKYKKKSIGIIFSGALARGYFDRYADLDIIIVGKNKLKRIPSVKRNEKYRGFQMDYHTTTLEDLKNKEWPMEQRWAFSEAIIYHDTKNIIKRLIEYKAMFLKGERKWLMIEGTVQSKWFCSQLPDLWVSRGDVVSAHSMFSEGLKYFFNALFALNNGLVPYEKWTLNYSRKLKWLPDRFEEKIKDVYLVRSFTNKELERRKEAFMYLWNQLWKNVRKEVRMSFEDMDRLV